MRPFRDNLADPSLLFSVQVRMLPALHRVDRYFASQSSTKAFYVDTIESCGLYPCCVRDYRNLQRDRQYLLALAAVVYCQLSPERPQVLTMDGHFSYPSKRSVGLAMTS